MTQTLSPARQATTPTVRDRRLRRGATLVAASILAAIVWLICVPVIGLELAVGSGSAAQTVTLPSVIIVPMLAGGAAWALLAVFERMFRHGRSAWLITAWAVLALALLEPVMMATGDVRIALLAMHLTVGLTLTLGLPVPTHRRDRVW